MDVGCRAGRWTCWRLAYGWGCMAQQVHQLLDVRSYTIIDLPQNLFLSSTYLAATANRRLQFARGEGKSVMTEPGSLLCALPGSVLTISQKYDVVVNSFSLQEMDLETVQAYLAWVGQALNDDGIFISFNAHGKAGVRAPSDYPLDAFRLESLGMFRAFPSGLLNTIPYEIVLTSRKGGTPPDAGLLDSLGCLFQLGLGDDLAPTCEQFVQGRLAPATDKILRQLGGFFSPAADKRKTALAGDVSSAMPAIHAYLAGLNSFAADDASTARSQFQKSLEAGLKGFARLRACAHLSLLAGRKDLPEWTADFDALLAYPELRRMLDERDRNQFLAQFNRIVSADLPRRNIRQ